ncbi:uncharacterized protein LOC117325409 [Pecten maximus]|uniref:uncharacterized protein LOC117325409 n=1 Tax=Pecten maximus TaxID=6579 RepID=UPI0014582AC1|nr:uncharacterized protein LOC117325409 [Pecten maximus]
MRAAFAEGTSRNLDIQWQAFFLFCEAFQREPLPVNTQTICLYIQFLSRSMKSPDSIRNYVSGVKTLHILTDTDYSQVRQFEVNLALRGVARLNPHCPHRASPITPRILLEFVKFINFSDPLHATLWCSFLLSFYVMIRKSNIVASSGGFKPEQILLRQDISVQGDMLMVCLKWSKTNQFGKRKHVIPLIRIPSSKLCPVLAFHNMCDLVPAPPEAPAFSMPGTRSKPISYSCFQKFLKFLIVQTGRDPALFSSHSFRRGGATWAFQSNVPGELIQLQGDWASDAYKIYLDHSLEQKMQVANFVKNSIITFQAAFYK